MYDAVPNESYENTMSNIMKRHANIAPHQQPIFRKMLTKIVEGDIIAAAVNTAMVCGCGRTQGSISSLLQKSTQKYPSAIEYVNLRFRVLYQLQDGSKNAVSATKKDTTSEPVPFDVKYYFNFPISIIVFPSTFEYFCILITKNWCHNHY